MTATGYSETTKHLLEVDRLRRGEGVFHFVDGRLSRSRLSRASHTGGLRRIANGVYTTDLTTEPSQLVRRNRWELIAHYIPDGVVSMRSSVYAGALTADSKIFLVSPTRRRDLRLDGLVVEVHHGPGAYRDDFSFNGVPIASDARTLVENLRRTTSKGGTRATLTRTELLQHARGLLERYGSRVERLLDRARFLSESMGLESELESILSRANRSIGLYR